MSVETKVVWSEGTLITPQHFQHNDQYYDDLIGQYYASSHLYGWGVYELSINLSAQKMGTISIDEVSGHFKNGVFFHASTEIAPQLKIQIPANLEKQIVYLAWSNFSHYKENYESITENVSTARYLVRTVEKLDYSHINLPKRNLVVSVPNLRLVLEDDLSDDEVFIPLMCVSTNSTGEVVVDDSYIPPCLNVYRQKNIFDYMSELQGIMKQRIISLSGLLTNNNLVATGDVRDFLMLQTTNRYFAYFQHLLSLPWVHPCYIFGEWLRFYGDLSSFSSDKYSVDFPIYQHDNLAFCFSELIGLLRKALAIVLEQRAIMIPLEVVDDATRIAVAPSGSLARNNRLVLAIQASLPMEVLLQHVPTTIKISSSDKLTDLISYHLPGVRVRALSTAPRELPYHAGYSYFELDKDSELWEDIELSSALAIHLAGNFPDLCMECWAIRPVQ